MTADPVGAAEELREFLEYLIRVCTTRARGLDRCVMAWPEETKEEKALLADISKILKIAESAQKMLTTMRKQEHEDRCRGSCETFAAAILNAREAARARGQGAAGGPPGE